MGKLECLHFDSTTLNTTHVNKKGVIFGGWPWNFARVFFLGWLCVSTKKSLWLVIGERIRIGERRESPRWSHLIFFHFKISWKFWQFNFAFVIRHVPNRLPLSADNWQEQVSLLALECCQSQLFSLRTRSDFSQIFLSISMSSSSMKNIWSSSATPEEWMFSCRAHFIPYC